MEEVVSWVNEIGLGEYELNFIDNHITGDILLILTESDLKDSIGIKAFGDIKKLRLAIDKLQSVRFVSFLHFFF